MTHRSLWIALSILMGACGGETTDTAAPADAGTDLSEESSRADGLVVYDTGDGIDAGQPADLSGETAESVVCEETSLCVVSATLVGDACEYVYAEAQTPCDDSDPETVQDHCDGSGECIGLAFDCEDELVAPSQWFEWDAADPLLGLVEFGQTHVTRLNEDRLAPPVTAERETLFLLTPDNAPSADATMRIAAVIDGDVIGVLAMNPPSALPAPLEQELTEVELAPYSGSAWSTTLPWTWMRPGTILRIGLEDGESARVMEHLLEDLGSPHRFTLTRTHMVLFGAPDFEVIPPQPAAKVAADMAPWVPGAELRWVDTSPWRLDKVVVNTEAGPRWAHSEEERLDITTDGTRWNIIKHQGALRLSLANTGRGLRMTAPHQGDSSPYSYGTSMVQGWVGFGDGTYADVNNAGLAAGWTGWSGMWLNECGNGFIHEVGHSFTLAHFTGGTSSSWGISEEYPLDGVNMEAHPWGYDSVRRRFRTWYRVGSEGPAIENGAWVGKRDPMNGGESPSSVSCYPQYTAYQMKRSQSWLQSSPTLLNVEGSPGVFRWSVEDGAYLAEEPAPDNQAPVAVDGPVITLTGTLGNLDEVCQTYPPIYIPEGNAFALPDPEDPGLPGVYNGGHWFLQIDYADGSTDRALIAADAIALEDTALYLYSLNLDATRTPTVASLHRSPTAYPNISVDDAELIHVRQIGPAPKGSKPAIRVGHGHLPNDELRLNLLCDVGVNCATRTATAAFPVADAALSFSPITAPEAPALCSTPNEVSVWQLPVVSDTGVETVLIAHAQRQVSAAPHEVRVPAHDVTGWLSAANMQQSLRVWLPYSENSGLAPGTYESPETFDIQVLRDGVATETLPIRVNLTVRDVETVVIPPNYMSAGLSIPEGEPNSSVYYVFEDDQIGPAGSKWWGDGSGNLIRVPVQDQETGAMATLKLRAHKVACGDWWEINTGQSADWGCTHSVHLALEPDANGGLVSGHTYTSPGSHPVVIKGLRWHQPNAGQVLGVLALRIEHTAP